MVKSDSEQEFKNRFRDEMIIPYHRIDSREKLYNALNKVYGKQRNMTIDDKRYKLALEVLEDDNRITKKEVPRMTYTIPSKTYFYYHGRQARYIERYKREEIIKVRGTEQIRVRNVKTGRFEKIG